MGAGGVQRAQHPPGRHPAPGAAGPAAAAAAGAGDGHLPGAQGALLAVLRSVPPASGSAALGSAASPRGCGSQIRAPRQPRNKHTQSPPPVNPPRLCGARSRAAAAPRCASAASAGTRAPPTGALCPSFQDELIREITINCAERGLLLLRVRDEIQMTLAAYQALYESSAAFGMRSALQAAQGKSDMEKRVSWALSPIT